MKRHVVRSTGAWDMWRDELRAGRRTPDEPTDALYFAALCDSVGLDRLDEYRETGVETLIRLAAMWFAESEGWLRRIPAQENAA